MIRANFHTHTTFCDGADTPEEMVDRALALGFSALGFSGHMDPEVSMDWDAYSAEVRRLASAHAGKLDILLGAELDSCFDPVTCAGAEYLIGSTHYVPVDGTLVCVDDTPERIAKECGEFFGGDWYALARAYFDFEARALPGRAINDLAEVKKDKRVSASAGYKAASKELAAREKELKANPAYVRLAKLEQLAAQVREYNPANKRARVKFTKAKIEAEAKKYADLKESEDPVVAREAKNCLADLAWAAAEL